MANDLPGVIPYLTIRGRQGKAAADFYSQVFGAEVLALVPAEDDERVLHCRLRINGGLVFLSDDFPELHGDVEAPEPASVTIHLQVDDAQAWWDRAMEAGCTARQEIEDQFWGERYGRLRDPFGHIWSVASRIRRA